jgi:predicted ferric reductase
VPRRGTGPTGPTQSEEPEVPTAEQASPAAGTPGARRRAAARPALHARPALLAAPLAAGAAAVTALWWQDTDPASLAGRGAYLTAAGRITGLLAAYLLLVLTLLLARIPVLENLAGTEILARYHRALGEYTVALVLAHAVLLVFGYALQSGTGPLTETADLVLDYPDVLMATASLALLVWVGVASARAVRRRLSYESWYFIHLYVYLAMALAFAHEFAVGADFSASARNREIWAGAHIAAAALWLSFRVLLPLGRSLRHGLRVAQVLQEGPGVVSVLLTGRGLDRMRASAGQYLRWRFLTREQWWQSHPYSLSAPPGPGGLRITVKDLGDASAALGGLRPGTRVWFEGPFGRFTAGRVHGSRRVLLLAAGAGITPVRALYEALPGSGPDVVLLYRAADRAGLALYPELAAIARRRGFGLYPLLGPRAPHDPLAAAELVRLVPDLARRVVFVCGSPALVAHARTQLRAAGVPPRRIHSESFDF